jgi:outer membrane protein TolC
VCLIVRAAVADVPALTFHEALDEIMRRSTSVATQQTNLDSAQIKAVPVRLRFVPDLAIQAHAEKARIDKSDLTGKRLDVTSTLNLVRFGGDFAAVRAAERDIDTEEARLLAARLDVELGAVGALSVRIQRVFEVEVSKRLVSMQTEFLKISRERYDHGLLPLQEVEKISVDLDNARARLSDAETAAYASLAVLDPLLGDRPVRIEWPWKDWFSNASAIDVLASRKLSLDAVPEYRAAKQKVEAEEERLRQSRAAILPTIDASLSYDYLEGSNSSTGAGYNQWIGGVTATIPLFDRLTNFSAARAQSATRQAAEIALDQAGREAQATWADARDEFRGTVTTALARDKTVAVSRKLFEDSLRRFRAGRAAANELNVDQQRLLDSEVFAVQGWSSAHIAYARLCRALGESVWTCLNGK